MRNIYLACGTSLLVMASAMPASAQAPAGSAAPSGAGVAPITAAPAFPSEDIVVTARRREESAQTVPVSVTAFGSRALQERTVRQLGDLTSIAPGLRFVQQGGGPGINAVLRGLSRVPVGDAPNAVITYFADIPLNFYGSNLPTYDLASVQVLKGPQGTLFGRNAIAGAIVITPQAPTYQRDGYMKFSGGNFTYRDVEGAFNLPLIDDVAALRVAGKVTRRDGYTHNLEPGGSDFDNAHQDSFRVSLLLEPLEHLRNVTVFDYFRADEVGTSGILSAVLNTGLVRLPALASQWDCHTANAFNPLPCAGFQPDRDVDDALARQKQIGPRNIYSNNLDSRQLRDIYGVANRTELSFGDFTLRNIFGWRRTRTETTGYESDGLDFVPTVITPNARVAVEQTSDEAQLLGKLFGGRLDFIVGAIGIDEKPFDSEGSKFVIAATDAPWVEAYNHKSNRAAYGQIGFKILDNLKLNAGYRYNHDRSKACTVTKLGAFTAEPPVGPDACASTAGSSNIGTGGNASTYTIGLDWQVSRHVFAYVTHRRGYREGGVNYPGFTSPCTTGDPACTTNPTPGVVPDLRPYQTYKPETITDWEIGLKTDWRIEGITGRFNISAYRGTYGNVQTAFNTSAIVSSSDAGAPQSSALVINTGARRLSGFETELTVRPVPTLSLTNSVAYTHQTILSAPAIPIVGLQAPALAGVSPKWATTTAIRWSPPFRPLDSDLVFNADYYYQTSFYVANAKLPSYGIANLRLELDKVHGSNVDVAFFMRNVFNKTYAVAGASTTDTLGVYTFAYGEPRMFGGEVLFRF